MTKGPIGVRLTGILLVFIGLGALAYFLGRPTSPEGASWASPKEIKVLAYSAFVNSWGPGPEIAKLFDREFGVKIVYQDAGDAGFFCKSCNSFRVMWC